MSKRTLFIGALFLALSCLSAIDRELSEWIAVITIILAGIPHGAFDLRLARVVWTSGVRTTTFIITVYLLSAVSMSALCILTPSIGFSLFILISIAHFVHGEQFGRMRSDRFLSLQMGLASVALPIGLHYKEARGFMGFFLSSGTLDLLGPYLRIFAWALTILLCLSLLGTRLSKRMEVNGHFVQRLLCLAGWMFLPPLSGFCIWFIGRHSLGHLVVCRELFKKAESRYIRDFILLSIAALTLLVPLSFLFDFTDLQQLFTATIVLIAGLTLPHIIIVARIPHTDD
jgi:Brp/Blh family beta-carotene 15,15'-monooxygenase